MMVIIIPNNHWFETEGCLIRVPHSWSTATRIDMQHLIFFSSYTSLNFSLKDKCNENVTLTLIVPRISRKHWIFQHGSWQAHLRPTSAEATFCGKSRQFSHSPNFSFQHCQVSHKSVPIAQMWISRVPADFHIPGLSSHTSPASLVTGQLSNPPMTSFFLVPQAPTRSHAPFETGHDWGGFVRVRQQKVFDEVGFLQNREVDGACSADPDRLWNFRR